MGMPAQQSEWTAEEAIALPADGNRYEVLDGELFVTPAPSWRHQAVVGRLFERLAPYVREQALGWAMLSPADISFTPRRLVQPDIFVVSQGAGSEPTSWAQVRDLLLTVEVLSPSTAHADRLVKRRIYQQQRVSEYWIIDLDARLVERWRPTDERPELVSEFLTWAPRSDVTPLRIEVASLVG